MGRTKITIVAKEIEEKKVYCGTGFFFAAVKRIGGYVQMYTSLQR
jgi:hypothetical protein